MTRLPEWWEPLRTRAARSRADDFGRLPAPVDDALDSAVLVLLGAQGADGPDVLLLQRAATLRHHAGQVAFPGGVVEPEDADVAATALREAQEEVGLDPTGVRIVTPLPPLWIPVSNFRVTPVLAWWHAPHAVGPVDHGEVARVERLTIAELVEPENRLMIRHPDGWVGPAFRTRGLLVWGFTAAVLSTVLRLGGWARPWSTSRVEDVPTASDPTVP